MIEKGQEEMLEIAAEALFFYETDNLNHDQRKREYNERYPESAWLFPSERFLPE